MPRIAMAKACIVIRLAVVVDNGRARDDFLLAIVVYIGNADAVVALACIGLIA